MQTQVITWAQCITEPKGEVGALAPISSVTDALILGYASTAQFELQSKSRAVHRKLEFSARRISAQHKSVDIDDDIWRISEVRRTVNHKQCGFITPVSLHELHRLEISDNHTAPYDYSPSRDRQQPIGVNRCAVDRRRLFFNFIPSEHEIIHVEYDPYLLPYSVEMGNLPGDWQGATTDDTGFDDYIQNNGPEAEFWMHITGIKGYVGMRLMNELGNMYIKTFSFKYYAYKTAWENALENVTGNQPNNTINDPAAAYIGPVD